LREQIAHRFKSWSGDAPGCRAVQPAQVGRGVGAQSRFNLVIYGLGAPPRLAQDVERRSNDRCRE